jgi:hypothetical protein
MKNNILTKLLLGIATTVMCITLSSSSAKAYEYYTMNVPLKTVTDIDNIPYPSTTDLFYAGDGYRNYTGFTLDRPGEVKAYFRWGTSVKGKGTVWFSRDPDGYDIISTPLELKSKNKSLTVFLDAGTYYMNSVWSEEAFEVGAALLYEPSQTEETVARSSFNSPNVLQLEKTTKGFLSETTPIDYYIFNIDKQANLTVTYSFDSSKATKPGLCGLYDANQVQLIAKEYGKSTKGAQSFTYMLQPGNYFIQMSDMAGNTTVLVEPMYYIIDLVPEVTEEWVKGPLSVDIKTDINVKEIWVVNKDVSELDLKNSDIWSKGSRNELYVPVDGTTFEAKKNGVYSVRILDAYGNYTMQKIDIKNVDITAPKVTGVSDGKAYKTSKKITWKDKQSGTNTSKATLNGKKVKSGVKVTEAGKYTLKLYDKVGNIGTTVFYIDFTAPTVGGVRNGRTYTEYKTVTFNDSISGIKKITVNGDEVRADTKSRRYSSTGTYKIKLWDKAGNYRKVTFKIGRNR